ncbi:hypothetical protein LPTSP4_23120 [Leptospira ryugenii]|uniref:Uncharacterized protein n=1 Tax=Leptospira ryugenii TaxID=1917863 RepID=A0A2P2E1M5_9LEPT|nr:hypothetical protein LPTSP4_23120 [Leptospira ryugenii]
MENPAIQGNHRCNLVTKKEKMSKKIGNLKFKKIPESTKIGKAKNQGKPPNTVTMW